MAFEGMLSGRSHFCQFTKGREQVVLWQRNNPNDENDGFKIEKKIYNRVFTKMLPVQLS